MMTRLGLGVMTAILMTPAIHASVSAQPSSNMPWEQFTTRVLEAFCEHLGICLGVIS